MATITQWNGMNPCFDLPLTLGIVTFSTRITSESGPLMARYRSSSLVLNSKFPTYGVSVVLLTFGSKYSGPRAHLFKSNFKSICHSIICFFADPFENFGTTKIPPFLYSWDLSLCLPPRNLSYLLFSRNGSGESVVLKWCKWWIWFLWIFWTIPSGVELPQTLLRIWWWCSWLCSRII